MILNNRWIKYVKNNKEQALAYSKCWGLTYMQIRKQQLELDMEQQTGSK